MAADSRVRWRCRRGIRELDLVFTRFLDRHYVTLTPAASACFDRLLQEHDLEIYDWLMGRITPPSEYLTLLALLALDSESVRAGTPG